MGNDGELYDLGGHKTLVIGGAYSVDKKSRTQGFSWWADEQPSSEIKEYVESQIKMQDSTVDVVLSHTAPLKYEPKESFKFELSGVDKSTEEWLDAIEDTLDYKKWYCGHYHLEKRIDKLRFMHTDVEEFGNDNKGKLVKVFQIINLCQPKYCVGQTVRFQAHEGKHTGEICVVDYGGATGHDYHTYDIEVEENNTIYKHVEQNEIFSIIENIAGDES